MLKAGSRLRVKRALRSMAPGESVPKYRTVRLSAAEQAAAKLVNDRCSQIYKVGEQNARDAAIACATIGAMGLEAMLRSRGVTIAPTEQVIAVADLITGEVKTIKVVGRG